MNWFIDFKSTSEVKTLKAYRDKKNRGNIIYLKIENPRDKQLAFQLNATIKSNNLAVLPVDVDCKDTLVDICNIFQKNDVMVDQSTNIFLRKALEYVIRKERVSTVIRNKAEEIKKRLRSRDKAVGLFEDYIGICGELLPHQKAGAMIADIFDRYAFYYDTGTGKTVLALEIIAQKEKKENASFLILCPKTIIKTAWMDDTRHFFPKMKLLPLSKNYTINDYRQLYLHWNKIDVDIPIEEKFIDSDCWHQGNVNKRLKLIKDKLLPRAKHFIVNPELFRLDVEFYKKLKCNGLIIDESAILKNYYSKITSCVRRFGKDFKYIYLLSGKPAPNHTLEYFPQMKMIDPQIFSMSFDRYKEKYYREDGYTYRFKTEGNKREVVNLIGSRSITLSKEDCIELPEKTYQVRQLTLPPDIMAAYNEMLHGFYIEFVKHEEKQSLSVATKLASLMKLRQITSGFVIKNNKPLLLHDIKEKELINLLDDIGNHQAIIWCQFQYEINRIVSLLKEKNKKVVTAYGNTRDVDESIIQFKTGKADYIVAHPKTLKYGVTLTNCTYAVYYSMSYSHEEYYQSHDRIFRKGQKNKCTYTFIQVDNTIDERIYDVVQNKKTKTQLFEVLMKDAEAVNKSI